MERLKDRDPDLKFWYRFSDYKYTFLAFSVVLFFFIMPFLEEHGGQDFVPFLLLMVMAAVLWTLTIPRWLLALCLVLGFLGFGFHLIIDTIGLSEAVSRVIGMAEIGVYTMFCGLCLLIFLHKIFSETLVTSDTIQGGIAVYFLSGLLWALFYQILISFDPEALSLPVHVSGEISEMVYFSFITLTTLGYGDITPVTWMAKNLALLEAVWGQIYLAVLVARLVGLHLSSSQNPTAGPPDR